MPEVRIPSVLQRATGGPGRVTLAAGTVGELITALETTHPGIRDRLLITDEGAREPRLAAHAHVFVDEADARAHGGLDAPLAGVATVTILPAVAGGCHRSRALMPPSTR